MTQYKSLRVQKVADKSGGERIKRFDQDTGSPYLLNPATGQAEPWPLLGLEVVDETNARVEPPKFTRVPSKWVVRGVAEGWLTLVGVRLEHRPGGPPEDPYRVTHTFTHADEVVLKTTPDQPDIRYQVTHQPDKYVEGGTDKTPVTPEVYAAGDTRVDHWYGLRLIEEASHRG
jgi:hypothetical protein